MDLKDKLDPAMLAQLKLTKKNLEKIEQEKKELERKKRMEEQKRRKKINLLLNY